jgi:hypothetical protein
MAEAVDGAAAIVEIVATAEIAVIAGKRFLPEINGTRAKPLYSRFRCHSLQLCPTPVRSRPRSNCFVSGRSRNGNFFRGDGFETLHSESLLRNVL